jgi:uncharacterized cysteine cluster protein YcgN (CxxCxxCC family)
MADDTPFWRYKTLAEMTQAEWESLCDGCGQCCLHKLQDVDTDEIALTDVACRLLDTETCRCRNYANRWDHVPDCVQLTPGTVRELAWLPRTCAYRKVAFGEPLDWGHPLVSGDPATVHEAGISVRGQAISEDEIDDIQDHIVSWLNERLKQGLAPLGQHGQRKKKKRRRK